MFPCPITRSIYGNFKRNPKWEILVIIASAVEIEASLYTRTRALPGAFTTQHDLSLVTVKQNHRSLDWTIILRTGVPAPACTYLLNPRILLELSTHTICKLLSYHRNVRTSTDGVRYHPFFAFFSYSDTLFLGPGPVQSRLTSPRGAKDSPEPTREKSGIVRTVG